MAIIIPVGLNEADPSGSCCIECCKDSCCACGVTGCLDVDILVWSDVGPSGDLVTSSCASGGGLSFTMCPRLDLCACTLPTIQGRSAPVTITYGGRPSGGWMYTQPWSPYPDYCYNTTPGDHSAGGSAPGGFPYPSGMCAATNLPVYQCEPGLATMGCREVSFSSRVANGYIAGTGNYSGSIMDDYPQMWGFSGKVCETCTSCGPPAYDSASCGGACIWATYCCSTGANNDLDNMTFSWGGWDCYEYGPTCPSGDSGGNTSGNPCDVAIPNVWSPCSPCATRETNQCVPNSCRHNQQRGMFGHDQYSVCGYSDCCNPYTWPGGPYTPPHTPDFRGCPCPWPFYPDSYSTIGCLPYGWTQPNPCQISLITPAETSAYMDRTFGMWPDTCFSFISGQCSIPSIGQKFIAVYDATMLDYDCDCQTHMCCDEIYTVEYGCDASTGWPYGCWGERHSGRNGIF